MAPKEKSNSLLAFLRAIRFTRKSRQRTIEPTRPFAGLSSVRQPSALDEADCIRSAN